MSKPTRQHLITRIESELADLRSERTALQQRLVVVEQLLAGYDRLLSPSNGRTVSGGHGVGSRSEARQHRKKVMMDYLSLLEDAATGDIVKHVKGCLPQDKRATRSAVTDILRLDDEFENYVRGRWRLRSTSEDAVGDFQIAAQILGDDQEVAG